MLDPNKLIENRKPEHTAQKHGTIASMIWTLSTFYTPNPVMSDNCQSSVQASS